MLVTSFLLVITVLTASSEAGCRHQPGCAIQDNDYPYDFNVSRKMFTFSAIAYHSDVLELRAWRCRACREPLMSGFRVVGTVSNQPLHLFAYVGYDPALRSLVVAIRGTDGPNLQNWLSVNLRFCKCPPNHLFPCTHGQVHCGFYNAYKTVRDQIWNHISRARNIYHVAPDRIYVTGHSMGGALAVLAALDLRVNRHLSPVMMNYGSPRVGDLCFAAYYSNHVTKSIRVAHRLDPATEVPPRSLLGYRHVPRFHSDTTSLADHRVYEGLRLSVLSGSSRRRRDVTMTDLRRK
eukprot:scpid89418/ scgid22208/ Lipase; Triacylglycerol lipase